MRRIMSTGILVVVLIPVLGTALLTGSHHTAALASPGESKSFVVLVSRHGFNGSSAFILTLNQGDVVKIKFIYDDRDLSYDNPHRMYLTGYSIETETIGRSRPEASIQFVASAPGSFKLYCEIPCTGMDKLIGDVIVEPSSEEGAAGLTLSPPTIVNGKVTVRVRATDANANPMQGAAVTFYWDTTFGRFLLGSALTDPNGFAEFTFLPETAGELRILAQSGAGEASATISMEPRTQASSSSWFTASNVSKGLVALVLASVWATFGFTAYLILRIRKARHLELKA